MTTGEPQGQWYLLDSTGQPTGPYTTFALGAMLRTGQLPPTAPANLAGSSEWKPVAEWPQLRPTVPWASGDGARSQTQFVIGAILGVVCAGLVATIVVLVLTRGGSSGPPAPVAATHEPVAPSAASSQQAAPEPKTRGEQILGLDTMSKALAFAKPEMADTYNEIDPGTALFAEWAMKRMKLADVRVTRDETTPALVMKDPEQQRGKRLCYGGGILEIHVGRVAGSKINEGILLTRGGELIKFLAAGSLGSLVQNSPARICGVATGKFDYSNSAGGTGHAIKVVGMFELPQNQ